MKIILTFLLALGVLACSKSDDKFYMPAEWEPHDAIWLGWEDESVEFHPTIVSLIKTLTPTVMVKVAVRSDSLLKVAKSYLYEQGVDSTKVRFYLMPGERYWIRDHGAAFLVNNKGEFAVADFEWNAYGYPGWLEIKFNNNQDSVQKYLKLRAEKRKLTGAVDSLMAVAESAAILKTNVKHEGGAIEVNGKGTLILCEATVFERNPERSKEELEIEFKKVLGVSNIIWMKKGLADDPLYFFRRITGQYVGGGTGGHTDEFVRFSNPSTIMLGWVNEDEKDLNPINKMNYERMSENLKILEQSRDQDGKPFTIVKVPLPDLFVRRIVAKEKIDTSEVRKWPSPFLKPSYFALSEAPKEGDSLLRVPAASYMNYLVTNGVVILPTYKEVGSSAAKEEQVRKIFQEQFPDRRLVFLNATPQNWQGGGIHCSTQQQPRKK